MPRFCIALLLSGVPLMPLAGCQSSPRPGSDILATYDKTGGIAAFNQRLVVRESGGLALDDKRAGRVLETDLDPGSLDHLRELLASSDFLQARRQYTVEGGADLITYTIEARTPRRAHTVTTIDSADHPPAVQAAIEELDRLAQLARERGRAGGS
jgi:hypothetical protein